MLALPPTLCPFTMYFMLPIFHHAGTIPATTLDSWLKEKVHKLFKTQVWQELILLDCFIFS